jgi:hypothetical protein
MKIVELVKGLDIALTNEETELLGKLHEGSVSRNKLDEREVVVANNMVIKDVLYRKNQDGRITYYKKTP